MMMLQREIYILLLQKQKEKIENQNTRYPIIYEKDTEKVEYL